MKVKEFEVATNIREELRIAGHQPVVGFKDTDEGKIFEYWIRKHGLHNIHFICSLAYNLGRVQGIRRERARRKAVQHGKD